MAMMKMLHRALSIAEGVSGGMLAAGAIEKAFKFVKDDDQKIKSFELVSAVADHQDIWKSSPKYALRTRDNMIWGALMSRLDDGEQSEILESWFPWIEEEDPIADVILHTVGLYTSGETGEIAALRILRKLASFKEADYDATNLRRTEFANHINWLQYPFDRYLGVKVRRASKKLGTEIIAKYPDAIRATNKAARTYNQKRSTSKFSRLADRLFSH